MALHHYTASRPYTLHFAEGHQQDTVFPKADDLRHDRAMPAFAGNLADLSDRREGTGGLNDNADRLSDTPCHGKRFNLFEPFAKLHPFLAFVTPHLAAGVVYPTSHRLIGSLRAPGILQG